MVKNPIQEERIKSYFLSSAKEIIRGEGVRALSVRTVAERAGYSYATLYNYYKDLKELVFHCVGDFLNELRDFVAQSNKIKKEKQRDFLNTSKAFCNYFVQYPGTFHVIFAEQMTEIILNDRITEEIDIHFQDIFNDFYDDLAAKKNVHKNVIFEMHKNIIVGALTFYILRRTPKSYNDFLKKIETSINNL